jgi:hypothetical protein
MGGSNTIREIFEGVLDLFKIPSDNEALNPLKISPITKQEIFEAFRCLNIYNRQLESPPNLFCIGEADRNDTSLIREQKVFNFVMRFSEKMEPSEVSKAIDSFLSSRRKNVKFENFFRISSSDKNVEIVYASKPSVCFTRALGNISKKDFDLLYR